LPVFMALQSSASFKDPIPQAPWAGL
jgi:hypothetical protein